MKKILLSVLIVMSVSFLKMSFVSSAELMSFKNNLIPKDVALNIEEILKNVPLPELPVMPYEILLNNNNTKINLENSQVNIDGKLKFSPSFGSNFVPLEDLGKPDNFLKESLIDPSGDLVKRYADKKIEIGKIHSVACILTSEERKDMIPFIRRPDSKDVYTMVDRVQAYNEDETLLLGELSDNRSTLKNRNVMFVLPAHAPSGIYFGRCALFVSVKVSNVGNDDWSVKISDAMYLANNLPTVRFEVNSMNPDDLAPSIVRISFNDVSVAKGSIYNPSKVGYFSNRPQKFKITAKGFDDVLGLKDIMLSFFYITRTEREVYMHLKMSEANCTSEQEEMFVTHGPAISMISWECTWDVDFNNEIPDKNGFIHLYDGYVADDFRLRPVCRGKYNIVGRTSVASDVCYATFVFEKRDPIIRRIEPTPRQVFPITPQVAPKRDLFIPRTFR